MASCALLRWPCARLRWRARSRGDERKVTSHGCFIAPLYPRYALLVLPFRSLQAPSIILSKMMHYTCYHNSWTSGVTLYMK